MYWKYTSLVVSSATGVICHHGMSICGEALDSFCRHCWELLLMLKCRLMNLDLLFDNVLFRRYSHLLLGSKISTDYYSLLLFLTNNFSDSRPIFGMIVVGMPSLDVFCLWIVQVDLLSFVRVKLRLGNWSSRFTGGFSGGSSSGCSLAGSVRLFACFLVLVRWFIRQPAALQRNRWSPINLRNSFTFCSDCLWRLIRPDWIRFALFCWENALLLNAILPAKMLMALLLLLSSIVDLCFRWSALRHQVYENPSFS